MANIAHQILMGKFVSIAGSAGIPVVNDAHASIFKGYSTYRYTSVIEAGHWSNKRVPVSIYLDVDGHDKVQAWRNTSDWVSTHFTRRKVLDVGNAMNGALGKHYYEHLGHGFFSAVYSEPEDASVVYKVGFKKDDSGAAYAAFCRNNQGRAGIPVIHNIEMLPTGQYVVMMEKLQSNEELPGFISDVICSFNTIVCGYYMEELVGEAGAGWVREKAMEFMNSLATAWATREPDSNGDYLVHNFWVMHYDDFEAIEKFLSAETIKYMVEYAVTAYRIHMFFRGLAFFDMHDGNWMINDDGLPIITDPVSYSRVAPDGNVALCSNL